jgi:hypothetical protein
LPNDREYVTPPLLPPAPPQDWELPAGEYIALFVEYEFLPKALLTQFIVTRHADIDRGRTLVWREGVVLRWSEDTVAEVAKVKSQGRDAFALRVQGRRRRDLLTAIVKTLRDLHDEYKGIRVSENLPCPCSGCRMGKNKQHFFDFENLKNRLEKGRRVVECDKSLEEVALVPFLGEIMVFDNLREGHRVVLQDVQSLKAAAHTIPCDDVLALLQKGKLEEALALLPKGLSWGLALSGDFQRLKQAWIDGILTDPEFLDKQRPLQARFLSALSNEPSKGD